MSCGWRARGCRSIRRRRSRPPRRNPCGRTAAAPGACRVSCRRAGCAASRPCKGADRAWLGTPPPWAARRRRNASSAAGRGSPPSCAASTWCCTWCCPRAVPLDVRRDDERRASGANRRGRGRSARRLRARRSRCWARIALFETPSTIMPERVVVVGHRGERRDLAGGRAGGVVVAEAHDHQPRHAAGLLEFREIAEEDLGAVDIGVLQVERRGSSVGDLREHRVAHARRSALSLRGGVRQRSLTM